MVKNGIDKERMIPTGYSYFKMLYPINPNQYQAQQNRRATIKILDCKIVKEMRADLDESVLNSLVNDVQFSQLEIHENVKKEK